MPKIKPFNSYLIKKQRAGVVVSPAYDSVTSEIRRQFAEENPDNFINTMRLQSDFPSDKRPTQEELLNTNRDCLQRLLASGSYTELSQPSMFVYRLGNDRHTQTGLVCEVGLQEYENGTLLKHESTRRDKEELLARYQEVVGAASSPICLTYPQNNGIDTLIANITSEPADLEFTTDDGENQCIWCVSDPIAQKQLTSEFAKIKAAYLTDGHHRAASSLRYAERMRKSNSSNNGDEPFNQLLIALFPDNQLNLLSFHRRVRDTNGLSVQQILDSLAEHFTVEKRGDITEFESSKHLEFGMFIESTWYRLELKPGLQESADPSAALDVSLLQKYILEPILGIKDYRRDSRLGYVAGVSGQKGIEQSIKEGWQIVFSCYPASIQQLMAVADTDGLMPPKSTYFDPKPRSGIFVRVK